jgi:predicted dehydrogenase
MTKTGKKIGMAVVGCGYWGPHLMRNFSNQPDGDLRWLVDQDPQRLKHCGERYPQTRTTSDLSEALADPKLQAVALATPVSTHYPLAKQCMLAGKHVLIEKPMAQTISECEELIALAEGKGLTLMVDHTFIFTGAVRKIHELIAAGELGRIYYFDSVRVNLGLFQHDVNVVWDLAPHDLSIMDYVLPQKPTEVSAHGACHVGGSRVENMAYLTLKFDDTTLAHFHVNWLAPAKIRRIIIGGSKKMLVYDDLSPDERIKIYDKGLVLEDGPLADSHRMLAGYRTGDLYAPNVDGTEALQRVTGHFLDCIRKRRAPESDGQMGLRIVKILAAAQESLAANGSWIKL